jgi:hypothetical protein
MFGMGSFGEPPEDIEVTIKRAAESAANAGKKVGPQPCTEKSSAQSNQRRAQFVDSDVLSKEFKIEERL